MFLPNSTQAINKLLSKRKNLGLAGSTIPLAILIETWKELGSNYKIFDCIRDPSNHKIPKRTALFDALPPTSFKQVSTVLDSSHGFEVIGPDVSALFLTESA